MRQGDAPWAMRRGRCAVGGEIGPPAQAMRQGGEIGPPAQAMRQGGEIGPPAQAMRQGGEIGPPAQAMRQGGGIGPPAQRRISACSYQLRSGIAYFFSKFAIFQGLDAQKVCNQAIFQGRHTRHSLPPGWEGSPIQF